LKGEKLADTFIARIVPLLDIWVYGLGSLKFNDISLQPFSPNPAPTARQCETVCNFRVESQSNLNPPSGRAGVW
jgi:hypothetical protein